MGFMLIHIWIFVNPYFYTGNSHMNDNTVLYIHVQKKRPIDLELRMWLKEAG